MDFVEEIRVGEEGTQAGVGTEIDRPAAILDAREVCRIGIAEDSSAEGNEAGMTFLL